MDILQIPAVAIFTGMIVSFTIVMMAVTLSDAIKGQRRGPPSFRRTGPSAPFGGSSAASGKLVLDQ